MGVWAGTRVCPAGWPDPTPPLLLPPRCATLQLVEAAEAKAYYGLASNYSALLALSDALYERESLTGRELRELLEAHGEP